MRRLLGSTTLIALLLAVSPALAGDKKDKDKDKEEDEEEVDTSDKSAPGSDAFKDEEEDDDAPKVDRASDDDTEDTAEPKDEDDFEEDEDGDEIKFEDEEEGQETVKDRQPGEDTAQLYREQQKKCADMTPDEEQLAWEKYLQKYPKTLFRERIDTRMEELSAAMFDERVPGSDRGPKDLDAAKREINFATPVKFRSVDPRTHASLGIELGFPSWFAFRADFEYAILRQLSAHVGIDGKVSNPQIHLGGKYAVIKSSRTGSILTPMLDLDILTSTNGVPLLLHPSVAFGQRINVLEGLDLQAQVGSQIDFSEGSGPIWTGGFNVELRPTEIVSAFVETDLRMKYIGVDDVPDSFLTYTATFGIRFRAVKPSNNQGDGRLMAGLAATAPYAYRFWGDYRGAADIVADYYFMSPSK